MAEHANIVKVFIHYGENATNLLEHTCELFYFFTTYDQTIKFYGNYVKFIFIHFVYYDAHSHSDVSFLNQEMKLITRQVYWSWDITGDKANLFFLPHSHTIT